MIHDKRSHHNERYWAVMQGGIVCAINNKAGWLSFPGGSVVKNPPANSGDTGSIPGPRRFHIVRNN